MRRAIHHYFMDIAYCVASRATCPRRKVGCVIVDNNNNIKATGFNGVPRGYPHCIDTPCPGRDVQGASKKNLCMAIHAEQNALIQCSDINSIEAIYVTTQPCVVCARLIANTSCKQVYYAERYDQTEGIMILKTLGIECFYIGGSYERKSN